MAMKWRKSSETLVQKFAELVPKDPRVERRKMFGYPAAFVAGNLFMGLHQESLLLRLSEEDRASLLRIEGVSVFEPMAGRPMREYVVVPSSMVDRATSLTGWIRRALNYAASLPPKKAGRSKSPAKSRHSPKRGSAKTRRR
jgi:TfoX/Sxy family transcriptional regulator of competence genes